MRLLIVYKLTSSWALNEPVECTGFGCKGRLNTEDGWTITLQPLTNEYAPRWFWSTSILFYIKIQNFITFFKYFLT